MTAGAINMYGLKNDFCEIFLEFLFEIKSKAKFDKWKYEKQTTTPKNT